LTLLVVVVFCAQVNVTVPGDVPVVAHCASAGDSGKIAVQPTTTAATVANDATLRLTRLSLAAENRSARQGARRKP
jgi:hypothetical protein